MAGDIDAARQPDTLVLQDVIEETGKRLGAARPPGKAAMKADRHHLGRAAAALFIEAIEAILEVGEELVAAVEALRGGEAHVVGIERIGNDEMPAAVWAADPVWQVVGIAV